EGEGADRDRGDLHRQPEDDPLSLRIREVEEGPYIPVHAERQFQDMGDELRRPEGHGLFCMGAGLVSPQIVVGSVVDSADLLESAQALLPTRDIDVTPTVDCTLLLVEPRGA